MRLVAVDGAGTAVAAVVVGTVGGDEGKGTEEEREGESDEGCGAHSYGCSSFVWAIEMVAMAGAVQIVFGKIGGRNRCVTWEFGLKGTRPPGNLWQR